MVSAAVGVDLTDGGRWNSLRLAGREWLWSGPGLASGPRTGDIAFTDAGGLDECFPTVRGTPDHGGLWNQVWSADGEWDVVRWGEAELRRRMNGGERPPGVVDGPTGVVWADYLLTAPAGYRFVWAAHALLDCAVGAVVEVPEGTGCRLYPDDGPWVEGSWSASLGTYGPTDGTAVGAVLETPSACVRDRGQELTFALSCLGNLFRRRCGATSAGSRSARRTGASGSSRCSGGCSGWTRPGRVMPRWCLPAANWPGGWLCPPGQCDVSRAAGRVRRSGPW